MASKQVLISRVGSLLLLCGLGCPLGCHTDAGIVIKDVVVTARPDDVSGTHSGSIFRTSVALPEEMATYSFRSDQIPLRVDVGKPIEWDGTHPITLEFRITERGPDGVDHVRMAQVNLDQEIIEDIVGGDRSERRLPLRVVEGDDRTRFYRITLVHRAK